MGLDEDDYDKDELYEIIKTFIEDYYFENDDVYELMPLEDDDLINFVDRYGDNINKILQADEDEEDVDEVEIEDEEQTGNAVQIEPPDDLQQITDNDLEDGVNYDGPDAYKVVVYPETNRTDKIRKWVSISESDDGSLKVQIANTYVEDIYSDLFDKMMKEGFIITDEDNSYNSIVVNSDSFIKVMTNLIYDMYLQNAYYKAWNMTDPSAWFG